MEPTLPEPTPVENSLSGQELMPVAAPMYVNEARPNTGVEQSHEAVVAPSSASPTVVTPPVQAPHSAGVPVNDVNTTTSSAVASSDPLIADDVDVIEKEWIDKAKKIVNATREDPRAQEYEVSKLQADYLMKRYNKQIKLSE